MKTNKNHFFLLLLLTIITNALVFAQPSGYEAQFKLGNQRLDQKDYDGAISAFTECLRLAPKAAACYGNRGIAYREKSNFSQAIADYTEAIKIDPNNALFYNGRAITYRRDKKYNLAIADLNASLKINPNDDKVRQLLESVKSLAEKTEQLKFTQAILEGTLTADTSKILTADDFFESGKQMFEKKDNSTAILYFSECLRLKPDFADCYFYRGQVHHQISQYEKALEDFTQAIKLQPRNVQYYRRRANTNDFYLKRYDAAIADLSEVIKLQPKDAGSYTDRGYVFKSRKDYQKAADDFTSAINLESSLTVKKVYYGVRADLYYTNLKNYPAAIADYTEYIKIEPQEWVGYANRGRVYLKNKNYEQAVSDYSKVIELGTGLTHTAYEERAQAYCGLGKRALALADEKKVREAGGKVEFPCQPLH